MLRGRKQLLGDKYELMQNDTKVIGLCLVKQGRYAEAEEVLQETVVLSQRVYGVVHQRTLCDEQNLGWCLYSLKKFTACEALTRKVLAGRKELLGPEHLDTLASAYNLVICLHTQKKHLEAQGMAQKLIVSYGQLYSMEHVITLKMRDVLGECLMHEGKYQEAVKTLSEVLEVRKRVEGEVHSNTQITAFNLAKSFSKQGKHAEAQVLHCDMFRACTLTHGPNDPKTLAAWQRLCEFMQTGAKMSADMLKREAEDPQGSCKKQRA